MPPYAIPKYTASNLTNLKVVTPPTGPVAIHNYTPQEIANMRFSTYGSGGGGYPSAPSAPSAQRQAPPAPPVIIPFDSGKVTYEGGRLTTITLPNGTTRNLTEMERQYYETLARNRPGTPFSRDVRAEATAFKSAVSEAIAKPELNPNISATAAEDRAKALYQDLRNTALKNDQLRKAAERKIDAYNESLAKLSQFDQKELKDFERYLKTNAEGKSYYEIPGQLPGNVSTRLNYLLGERNKLIENVTAEANTVEKWIGSEEKKTAGIVGLASARYAVKAGQYTAQAEKAYSANVYAYAEQAGVKEAYAVKDAFSAMVPQGTGDVSATASRLKGLKTPEEMAAPTKNIAFGVSEFTIETGGNIGAGLGGLYSKVLYEGEKITGALGEPMKQAQIEYGSTVPFQFGGINEIPTKEEASLREKKFEEYGRLASTIAPFFLAPEIKIPYSVAAAITSPTVEGAVLNVIAGTATGGAIKSTEAVLGLGIPYAEKLSPLVGKVYGTGATGITKYIIPGGFAIATVGAGIPISESIESGQFALAKEQTKELASVFGTFSIGAGIGERIVQEPVVLTLYRQRLAKTHEDNPAMQKFALDTFDYSIQVMKGNEPPVAKIDMSKVEGFKNNPLAQQAASEAVFALREHAIVFGSSIGSSPRFKGDIDITVIDITPKQAYEIARIPFEARGLELKANTATATDLDTKFEGANALSFHSSDFLGSEIGMRGTTTEYFAGGKIPINVTAETKAGEIILKPSVQVRTKIDTAFIKERGKAENDILDLIYYRKDIPQTVVKNVNLPTEKIIKPKEELIALLKKEKVEVDARKALEVKVKAEVKAEEKALVKEIVTAVKPKIFIKLETKVDLLAKGINKKIVPLVSSAKGTAKDVYGKSVYLGNKDASLGNDYLGRASVKRNPNLLKQLIEGHPNELKSIYSGKAENLELHHITGNLKRGGKGVLLTRSEHIQLHTLQNKGISNSFVERFKTRGSLPKEEIFKIIGRSPEKFAPEGKVDYLIPTAVKPYVPLSSKPPYAKDYVAKAKGYDYLKAEKYPYGKTYPEPYKYEKPYPYSKPYPYEKPVPYAKPYKYEKPYPYAKSYPYEKAYPYEKPYSYEKPYPYVKPYPYAKPYPYGKPYKYENYKYDYTYKQPPPPTGIIIPNAEGRKAANDNQAYNALVYSRSKWKKVNKEPLNKIAAQNEGAYYTDNSTAARYKYAKTAGKPKRIDTNLTYSAANKFRANKTGNFIERNTYRIDTPNEVRGIPLEGLLAQQRLRKGGLAF
jgi:hypothetical protein